MRMMSWRHGEREEYDARLGFASERDPELVVTVPVGDEAFISYAASKERAFREIKRRTKATKSDPRGRTST
jgi:hypothetical protein